MRISAKLVCVAAAMAFVAACSSSSGGSSGGSGDQLTITGLKAPGSDSDVSINLTTGPDYIKQCASGVSTMTQREFATNCTIPYINGMWTSPEGLLRPHSDLSQAAQDWLLNPPSDGLWPIYYPGGNKAAKQNIDETLKQNPASNVVVKELPNPLPIPGTKAGEIYMQAGLLFLPNSYIVPGGIFNEQYGWDTFFIIKGLLSSAEYALANPTSRYFNPTDQQFVQLNEQTAQQYATQMFQLAKGMADNHAFMINFYAGMVNNANRIYYLTRSQPPLFAHEVAAVKDFADKHPDITPYQETLAPYLNIKAPATYGEWLSKEILPAARTYFDYFTDPNHLIFNEKTNPRVMKLNGHNVSTYMTDGIGPVPEVTNSQVAGNKGYYEDVKHYFDAYPEANPDQRFMTGSGEKGDAELTQTYYASDRATRASGYDLSGRFGDVGQWDAMYAPVDLQTLLYQYALDYNGLIKRAATDGQSAKSKPVPESQIADMKTTITTEFWKTDEAGGRFTDRFVGPGPTQPDPYLYVTALVPMWADNLIADAQASDTVKTATESHPISQRSVEYSDDSSGKKHAYVVESKDGQMLKCQAGVPNCQTTLDQSVPATALLNAQNYGIPTSLWFTGNQWDYANAWAPDQYFAANGLYSHGFKAEGQLVDQAWLNTVDIAIANTGILIEKYVVTNPLNAPAVTAGYSADNAGFDWTNAYYMDAFSRQSQ